VTTTPAQSEHRASARERLLAAANELFYAEGVQTVGIDRIIEKCGLANPSLTTEHQRATQALSCPIKNGAYCFSLDGATDQNRLGGPA